MKLTRRDLLKFAAGSAVGIACSPAPWKMLEDSAMWTQNWPWIPEPGRGESTYVGTTCTLCPSGCGVSARCINSIPIRLSGIPGHPLGHGTLCVAGLSGHHLSYHPLRASHPLRRIHSRGASNVSPLSKDEAISSLKNAITSASGLVAVLDARPGRAISTAYQGWLSNIQNGISLTPMACETGTLNALSTFCGAPTSLGMAFDGVKTVLSLGTPMLDGWGTPARQASIVERLSAGSLKLVQVEPVRSRTAMGASEWIPIRPGTELLLCLGLARVLVEEGRASKFASGNEELRRTIFAVPLNTIASATNIPVDVIVRLARSISSDQPAILVGGGDVGAGPFHHEEQAAIALVNALISAGSVIVERGTYPWEGKGTQTPNRTLAEVPDRAIDVLILDGTEGGTMVPWEIIEPKLSGDKACVVSLSPFVSGLARRADLIIPSPAPYEMWNDVPAQSNEPRLSYAVSAPLRPAPDGTIDPLTLLRRLGAPVAFSTLAEIMHDRVSQLYAAGRGSIFTGAASVPISASTSAFEQLTTGSVWMDDDSKHVPAVHLEFPGHDQLDAIRHYAAALQEPETGNVSVVLTGTKALSMTAGVSPILSKVYQESNLRRSALSVGINPATLAALNIKAGDRVALTNGNGTCTVEASSEESTMPGVALVCIGPDPEAINDSVPTGSIHSVCAHEDGTWRIARATLAKA